MAKIKIVNLSEVYPKVMLNLERLHYEVMTKERILGIAISMGNVSTQLMDKYYEEYLSVFKQYEDTKNFLHNNYIAKENPNNEYLTWEADFLNKSVILHG